MLPSTFDLHKRSSVLKTNFGLFESGLFTQVLLYLSNRIFHSLCLIQNGLDSPFLHFKEPLVSKWLGGRVLDSRPRGRRFEPHRRHCVVVLEQDTRHLS